jgi:integrase
MQTIKGDWENEIKKWLDYLAAAGRADSTMRSRREHVSWLARDFCTSKRPFEVTLDDLMQWAAGFTWVMETRRGVRTSVRQFYAWAVDTGRVEESPAEKWPKVPSVIPQPRPASERDYEHALSKARKHRDRVMVRLACEAGLRRAEVASVHANDLFEDLDGWMLWVHGKGGTLQTVPLTDSVARDLINQIKRENDGQLAGWAFPGEWGDSGHMSPQWVGKIVARLLPGAATMHQLRHKFGTDVHAETGDLLTTQQLLRHATVATTQRYVRVPAERARAAVKNVYEDRLRRTA